MPQWIAREYLARRGGAKFKPEQLAEARCPLLGSVPRSIQIEGTFIPDWMINVDKQPEVGVEGYDAGGSILYEFFEKEFRKRCNVILALPERRHIYGQDIKPVIQITPEFAAFYLRINIAIGRSNDTHINGDRIA